MNLLRSKYLYFFIFCNLCIVYNYYKLLYKITILTFSISQSFYIICTVFFVIKNYRQGFFDIKCANRQAYQIIQFFQGNWLLLFFSHFSTQWFVTDRRPTLLTILKIQDENNMNFFTIVFFYNMVKINTME